MEDYQLRELARTLSESYHGITQRCFLSITPGTETTVEVNVRTVGVRLAHAEAVVDILVRHGLDGTTVSNIAPFHGYAVLERDDHKRVTMDVDALQALLDELEPYCL